MEKTKIKFSDKKEYFATEKFVRKAVGTSVWLSPHTQGPAFLKAGLVSETKPKAK